MKGDTLSLVADEAVPVEEMDEEGARAVLEEARGCVAVTDEEDQSKQNQAARARTMLHLLRQSRQEA